ncbi:MAG: tyrosine-type recombinase/integrase [Propionibacteriales bacterium]|nr:tyrosine-type recombinase/integrase [Propionibacteriales bacterium]
MKRRRERGEGSIYWDDNRKRWIGQVYVGYTPAGKRKKVKVTNKNKTKVKAEIRRLVRDLDDGVPVAPRGYTVGDAVEGWLRFGLPATAKATVEKHKSLARTHIIPSLGHRPLHELSAEEIDEWLFDKVDQLGTDALKRLLSILRRSINRAQARDKVRRNVALLCEVPKGRPGRPSKALSLQEASALLRAAEGKSLHAYIVVSLLTGARTEELRALTWDHVDLDGDANVEPPIPPSIQVWRSVREDRDTKTLKSRRTLQLPQRCVDALRDHKARQDERRKKLGDRWQDNGLVFASRVGTELYAGNVRRAFRIVAKKAGLDPESWTPRELRHSFVSLLSNQANVPIEDIARLVGHGHTKVTETVYRLELRPMLTRGAEVMDQIFVDPQLDPQVDADAENTDEDR